MGKFKSFWLAILLLVFLSTSFAAGIERKDAVKDQSNTTGTVSFVITGVAPNGARTITSAHTTGSTVRYRAVNVDGSQWEDGEGVWTSATNTLTRVTVFASSNSGSLTNFTTSPISILTVPTAKDFDVPDWAAASNIASASTVNLDAATGGIVHITGTTTITGVTLTRGPRLVIFDGILTLTHNSTTNNLPGGANITTAAGDRAYYMSDGTTVYVADYTKVSGQSVAATASGLTLLATVTPTAVASLDFLTTFSSSYDNYKIIVQGVKPSADDVLLVRFASGGTLDSGSNYIAVDVSSTVTQTSMDVTGGGTTITSAGKGMSVDLTVTDANDATNMKGLFGIGVTESAGNYQSIRATNAYIATNAISGFRLYWSSGANFAATGKIRVYGYSN